MKGNKGKEKTKKRKKAIKGKKIVEKGEVKKFKGLMKVREDEEEKHETVEDEAKKKNTWRKGE